MNDHAQSGDGTPGPAREAAEPSETARQLAQRWRQEAEEHPVRQAGDLLLLCAIELESVLGDSGGPREAHGWRDLYSDWLDFTVTRMKAGEPAGTAQGACVAFERFAKGWLRAELADAERREPAP